jgi:hypothetical protein
MFFYVKLINYSVNTKGSPRYMRQNYQDALTIVKHFGKPDLFITFTANPQWPEIQNNLDGLNYMDRPDICVRVFWEKFDAFCREVLHDHVLIIYKMLCLVNN